MYMLLVMAPQISNKDKNEITFIANAAPYSRVAADLSDSVDYVSLNIETMCIL